MNRTLYSDGASAVSRGDSRACPVRLFRPTAYPFLVLPLRLAGLGTGVLVGIGLGILGSAVLRSVTRDSSWPGVLEAFALFFGGLAAELCYNPLK